MERVHYMKGELGVGNGRLCYVVHITSCVYFVVPHHQHNINIRSAREFNEAW